MRDQAPARVVVLGAGITGLCAADELVQRARREKRRVEVKVLEASPRVGGKVLTETREGVSFEAGPDSFITAKPEALELARELGLAGELLPTHSTRKTVWVLSRGALHPLPVGLGLGPTRPLAFLRSKLLSWGAKARILLEPFVPADEGEQDESLGSFIRRRLGDEALELLVGPVLGGIYAADPDQLSLQSAFPQLKALERGPGLVRGFARPPAGGPAAPGVTLFMTLKGGLSRLTEALALRLPPQTVLTGVRAVALRRQGAGWRVQSAAGDYPADAVVSALPAPALAQLVEDLDFEMASVLREIPFVSTATVSFLYDSAGFPHPLDGFGFVVPRREEKTVTAATFASSKFPGRVPEGSVLVRCFVGGAGREAAAEGDDASIARAARQELRDILGLGERHPRATRVHRWLKANPQYTVGHALRLKRLESCLQGHPRLFLAGCSYHGVGLPDCIRSGKEAAARALRAAPAVMAAGVP